MNPPVADLKPMGFKLFVLIDSNILRWWGVLKRLLKRHPSVNSLFVLKFPVGKLFESVFSLVSSLITCCDHRHINYRIWQKVLLKYNLKCTNYFDVTPTGLEKMNFQPFYSILICSFNYFSNSLLFPLFWYWYINVLSLLSNPHYFVLIEFLL